MEAETKKIELTLTGGSFISSKNILLILNTVIKLGNTTQRHTFGRVNNDVVLYLNSDVDTNELRREVTNIMRSDKRIQHLKFLLTVKK